MNNITPSAPPLENHSDIESNYEIDVNYVSSLNTPRENNHNHNITCNKKVVLNILIGLFFVSSIAYIIYVNNEYIYNGLKEIKNIEQIFN